MSDLPYSLFLCNCTHHTGPLFTFYRFTHRPLGSPRQPEKVEVGNFRVHCAGDRDGAGRGLSPAVWDHSVTLDNARGAWAIFRQSS